MERDSKRKNHIVSECNKLAEKEQMRLGKESDPLEIVQVFNL